MVKYCVNSYIHNQAPSINSHVTIFSALHYVIEILPESENAAKGENFEPLYTCELCCVTTQGIPMFAHLTGNKHRLKIWFLYRKFDAIILRNDICKVKQWLCCRQTYLEMRFREYDLDKFGILKRSQEIQDKEGKRIDLIKTIKSK